MNTWTFYIYAWHYYSKKIFDLQYTLNKYNQAAIYLSLYIFLTLFHNVYVEEVHRPKEDLYSFPRRPSFSSIHIPFWLQSLD